MKDTVNVKSGGILNMDKGASKSLGIFGAGLNYYSNYHDDKDEGLSTGEAASRITVGTAVDTAVGRAVHAGFTAAGTALILIPGVGTAIGVEVGMIANWGIKEFKFSFGNGPKKSITDPITDRAKGALHKIKGWFS